MIRQRKPMVRKTPMKRVSARRQRESKVYAAKRKAFLAAHPVCQVWLKENGWHETSIGSDTVILGPEIITPEMPQGGRYLMQGADLLRGPRSTEIHHREKRGKNYLNESTWMAVSAENHRLIEHNKGWARARGYLA